MQHLEELMNKANEVREATESSCSIDEVEEYVTGFNSWLQHPPVPARPIWSTAMFESSRLAEASFFLAVHGFYDEACAVLRGVLDGFLTRLYWDTVHKKGELKEWKRNGKRIDEYWEWESGAAKGYPSREKVLSTLLKEESIARFEEYNVEEEIRNRFRLLDRHVHGRPVSRHYPGATRSSLGGLELKEKHFEEWYEHLRAVYRLVSALSILQYPQLLRSKYGQEFATLESGVVNSLSSVTVTTPHGRDRQ